ncbi:uncharacterized protein LOC131649734 [Vicia villosa]|uniref:uncharacterized protein LOC131649734 n=1 Tax=Vicia villosa TaxID=3911 RepID=UPI00273C0AC3|nr:uncharacterized protein LOC131649734 [Vicia villosa]
MVKHKKIDAFFKRKISDENENCIASTSTLEERAFDDQTIQVQPNDQPRKIQKVTMEEFDINCLERDPGKRLQIWEYPVNQRDEVRRAYLNWGPYQCQLEKYPLNGDKYPRRFQASWFKMFPSWLEYSPTNDAAYCLLCYLFCKKPSGHPGADVFTRKGFKAWRKVNSGKKCAFLIHIGDSPCSPHNNALKSSQDLFNQSIHIRNVLNVQCADQVIQNRLRLKSSIDSIRWLAFQACSFRGHDESLGSKNRGNFLEMVKLLASYNDELAKVVLENAPYNSKYTSHSIQKEILHIMSSKAKSYIREEIGDSKFCIIVDESRDESLREQMAIILRFVDKNGCIQERFFELVHVKDTMAITLKNAICDVLSRHGLNVSDIRGQGYDGASNMRGEWNGLQALFLKDCPYAYYIHCFAHRLQLALVAASREVFTVHDFFSHLTFIVNVVCSSSKRHDELQDAILEEISNLLEIGELDSGKGQNQIGTLKRAGDTRWSSHFSSVRSMIDLHNPTCVVLNDIRKNGRSYATRGDANAAYKFMKSFEFTLILHMMRELMGITDRLCQALQQKSQDILNAMQLVSTTKTLIQKLRDDGWDDLLKDVILFCEEHDIDSPDCNAVYIERDGRARHQMDHITVGQHFRVNLFCVTIDQQLQELNHRFCEQTMELLSLSNSLVPKDIYKAFDMNNICALVNKFYPMDFSEHEKISLRYQLQHFHLDVVGHPDLNCLSTMSELCEALKKTGKADTYYLIDRLIRLILTLPVSTATTERSFSAMKIIKTRLRNKMEDEFLADNMMLYIEKEIVDHFSTDSIIDEFKSLKERKAVL